MGLDDPISALLVVRGALLSAGIRAAAYGGLALAAYGVPRETRDADLAIAGTTTEAAVEALRGAGIDASLTFARLRMGGLLVTRFGLWGARATDGLNVADLVEPRSPRYAAAALSRAIEAPLRGESVAVLEPEDFIVFKLLSTRELDVKDAASVWSALGAEVDGGRIALEVARLAAEIADHDISSRLASLHAMRAAPGAG